MATMRATRVGPALMIGLGAAMMLMPLTGSNAGAGFQDPCLEPTAAQVVDPCDPCFSANANVDVAFIDPCDPCLVPVGQQIDPCCEPVPAGGGIDPCIVDTVPPTEPPTTDPPATDAPTTTIDDGSGAPTGRPGQLPETGRDDDPLLIGAGALLAAGGLILLAARRRPSEA
jgi:LPXTG-motif cell wall-anchored protein